MFSRFKRVIPLVIIAIAHLSSVSARAAGTDPVHPLWSPMLAPLSLIAPGSGHLIRGERRTAASFFGISGVSALTFFGAASALAASGASGPLAIVVVPLLLLSGSTYMTMGTLDLVGTYSENAPEPAGAVFRDRWGSDLTFSASYLYGLDRIMDQRHFTRIHASKWLGRFVLDGEVTAAAERFNDFFYSGNVAYQAIPWKQDQRDGLFVEAGVLREDHLGLGFSTTRLHYLARSILPVGRIFPSLNRVTSILHLGYLHRISSYESSDALDLDSGIVGGFEVRWSATDHFRPYWGYEHGRSGIEGGVGTGFMGVFHFGAEYQAFGPHWLGLRTELGSPNTFEIYLERRWE